MKNLYLAFVEELEEGIYPRAIKFDAAENIETVKARCGNPKLARVCTAKRDAAAFVNWWKVQAKIEGVYAFAETF